MVDVMWTRLGMQEIGDLCRRVAQSCVNVNERTQGMTA